MALPTHQIVERPIPMDNFDVFAVFHEVGRGDPLPEGWQPFKNARSSLGEGLIQTAAGPGNNISAVAELMKTPGILFCRPDFVRNGMNYLGDHQFGRTPLASIPPMVVAAAWGNVDIVEFMHQTYQMPYNIMSVAGLTPLVAAMMNSEYDCVRWLRNKIPSLSDELPVATMMPANNAVAMAAFIGDPMLFSPLQVTAADLNRYYRLNERALGINAPHRAVTPLGIAMWRGRDQGWTDADVAETVAELLQYGADPNQPAVFAVTSMTSTRYAPLQVALNCRYQQCVRLLLIAGANPNQVLWSQSSQWSPADLAFRYGLPDAAKYLLAVGGKCLNTAFLESTFASRKRSGDELADQQSVRIMFEKHRESTQIDAAVVGIASDRALFRRAVHNVLERPLDVRFSDLSANFALRQCSWSQQSHWCLPRWLQQLAKAVIEAHYVAISRGPAINEIIVPLELWWMILSFVMA